MFNKTMTIDTASTSETENNLLFWEREG